MECPSGLTSDAHTNEAKTRNTHGKQMGCSKQFLGVGSCKWDIYMIPSYKRDLHFWREFGSLPRNEEVGKNSQHNLLINHIAEGS